MARLTYITIKTAALFMAVFLMFEGNQPLAAAPARAADSNTKQTPPFIDEIVTSVSSGGYWEQGSQHGVIRVIVVQQGWEHVTSRVYLEWIEEQQTGILEIVRQAPLHEINRAGAWSIGMPSLRLSNQGLIIDLPASHPDSSRNKTFKIMVPIQGLGRYQIE